MIQHKRSVAWNLSESLKIRVVVFIRNNLMFSNSTVVHVYIYNCSNIHTE
jgi:hypothetical protein